MSDTNPTPTTPPKQPKSKSPASTTVSYQAQIVNPAWVTEVVKSYGMMGKPGEKVAAALSTAIGKQLAKATSPEKLDKLVLGAMAEAIRKRGS
jgi:hypothetical protein